MLQSGYQPWIIFSLYAYILCWLYQFSWITRITMFVTHKEANIKKKILVFIFVCLILVTSDIFLKIYLFLILLWIALATRFLMYEFIGHLGFWDSVSLIACLQIFRLISPSHPSNLSSWLPPSYSLPLLLFPLLSFPLQFALFSFFFHALRYLYTSYLHLSLPHRENKGAGLLVTLSLTVYNGDTSIDKDGQPSRQALVKPKIRSHGMPHTR